ncbi:MAG TPA: ATP-binding protein [Candidatus Limnocylindria bacterium]|nr:ATP-binding protein [Candidatus Limnocylindria bacterium]
MGDVPALAGQAQRLEIQADVGQLAAVRAFVRDGAASLGAPPRAVGDLVQAVDESVANIILHGYRAGPGQVIVEVGRAGPKLVVRLLDNAPAFDPTALPAPDLSLPLLRRRPGGLGVFLVRELTDEVHYRRTAQGNELTLVKSCFDDEEEG